jgi:hypothetical protein
MLLPVCESQKRRKRHEGGVRQAMLEECAAVTWIPIAKMADHKAIFYLKKLDANTIFLHRESSPGNPPHK